MVQSVIPALLTTAEVTRNYCTYESDKYSLVYGSPEAWLNNEHCKVIKKAKYFFKINKESGLTFRYRNTHQFSSE